VRSVYRDIATLQEQGAKIEGEAGIGYILRPGDSLPPLMFSEDEIEAIVLGSRWVADRGDSELALAAQNALAKIAAVLPEHLRHTLDSNALLVGPSTQDSADDLALQNLRIAIRKEQKVQVDYQDKSGKASSRIIWPCAIGYFDRVQVLVAWCELRSEFRHFRTDQILQLQGLEQKMPKRRQVLLAEWRKMQGITQN